MSENKVFGAPADVVGDCGFDFFPSDDRSRVFQVFPKVFGDSRGWFCEVAKDAPGWDAGSGVPLWFSNLGWVRQVNRSSSCPGAVRGCHAQAGAVCQGKLVSAVTERIYDVVTDARPDSATFGSSSVFVLDPALQNMLWVPRGFLHAFAVPPSAKGPAVFEYFCDNVYSKGSEVGVAPASLLPDLAESLASSPVADKFAEFSRFVSDLGQAALSEKDSAAEDYASFMSRISLEYEKTGKAWYR